METISINNYKNKFPKSIINSASKCKVRECDEIEKNVFQAYVDEVQNSFDVMLKVNDAREVVSFQCDCGKKTAFCEHVCALMMFLSKAKTAQNKRTKDTKINPIDQVLSAIDSADLKVWLKIQLHKNKDLALSFMHQFSRTTATVSPSDIKADTFKVVTAVINKRGKANAAEAKKIVDLWSDIHGEIVNSYFAAPGDENRFQLFQAIISTIDYLRMSISTGSQRIAKYLKDLVENGSAAICQIEDKEERKSATDFVMSCILQNRQVYPLWLSLVYHIAGKSSEDQKKNITISLYEFYEKNKIESIYNGNEYTKVLFDLLVSTDLFKKNFKLIKPIRYDNAHNLMLIQELIAINQLDMAKQYCQQQIEQNTNAEYDLEYLEFLKEIYTIQEDAENLTKILMALFPINYDFNEYLYIIEHLKDADERKKWRSKALTSARRNAGLYNRGQLFAFQLMDYERDYKKMLTYVDSDTSYEVLATFAEKMILTDKYKFLSAVFQRIDSLDELSEGSDENTVSIDILIKLIKKYYSSFEIESAIKSVRSQYFGFNTNLLVEMLKLRPGGQ